MKSHEHFQQFINLNRISPAIELAYLADETDCIRLMQSSATATEEQKKYIQDLAIQLVEAARGSHRSELNVESFLKEYNLDTAEGLALMCLAEALIRIPDTGTAQIFIQDKLGNTEWQHHLGQSASFWVNATTWGLLITGKLFHKQTSEAQTAHEAGRLKKIIHRLGGPFAHRAIQQAMGLIAQQFVSGQTIEEAIDFANGERTKGYTHSYDMLGEAALTQDNANQYIDAYLKGIEALKNDGPCTHSNSSISIKLSALHPRFEFHQLQAIEEISYRLLQLVTYAQSCHVPVTIDAEESYRLESTMAVFEKVFRHESTKEWPYLGIAVQAYQKRAFWVIDWLKQLAEEEFKMIPVRLVKGAYWDAEIKYAQQQGHKDYPVFCNKNYTDISYLACAKKLFDNAKHCPSHISAYEDDQAPDCTEEREASGIDISPAIPPIDELESLDPTIHPASDDQEVELTQKNEESNFSTQLSTECTTQRSTDPTTSSESAEHSFACFYPQFATHNAHTVAAIIALSIESNCHDFEFQRLHGMGKGIYDHLLQAFPKVNCRIYAPVGEHRELLPYLVRRMLENGANSSFVKQLNDDAMPAKELTRHPIDRLYRAPRRSIPLPPQLYGEARKNSQAFNLYCEADFRECLEKVSPYLSRQWLSQPVTPAIKSSGTTQSSKQNPSDFRKQIGSAYVSDEALCQGALDIATRYFPKWKQVPAIERADYLNKLADLLEIHQFELMSLCITEAGKTFANAQSEVREAVDFCRYYAQQCVNLFADPTLCPGPTGETNHLSLQGRGVFCCISPWNFPIAIFLGQIVAALAAGNCVLVKPANSTELIAYRIIELCLRVGIPKEALHYLPSTAACFSKALLSDTRVTGVVFTGSTQVARQINRQLAERDGPMATVIAETGGLNAMLVDSTALPEQLVIDVIASAFDSAGQRCSACRVLFLQNDIADRVITLIQGRMALLKVGNSLNPSVDIGPVISRESANIIQRHIDRMRNEGTILAQTPIDPDVAASGYYIAPTLIEIERLNQLHEEVFGPVLHVIRYPADSLNQITEQINQSGFGLTLGIHTRIESRAKYLAEKINVGNVYINRNMIGATVGVQPFGGQGLSGTGPKAGGPHYLTRFATEKTITINTTAVGGNTQLLSEQTSRTSR